MDLSLRAYLCGWKMLFLDRVTVLNEIPSDLGAYRKQQHRWTCGPVQLSFQSFGRVWASRRIPFYSKLNLVFLYFILRKMCTHVVSLGFFCILVPLCMFFPEVIVAIPLFALVHVPIAVTVCTSFFTPRKWYLCPLHLFYGLIYVLFENAMGIVKLWAVRSIS
jgi:beta-mannan synthase